MYMCVGGGEEEGSVLPEIWVLTEVGLRVDEAGDMGEPTGIRGDKEEKGERKKKRRGGGREGRGGVNHDWKNKFIGCSRKYRYQHCVECHVQPMGGANPFKYALGIF